MFVSRSATVRASAWSASALILCWILTSSPHIVRGDEVGQVQNQVQEVQVQVDDPMETHLANLSSSPIAYDRFSVLDRHRPPSSSGGSGGTSTSTSTGTTSTSTTSTSTTSTSTTSIPLIWHIPKAGGTFLKHVVHCLRMVVVSGLPADDPSLVLPFVYIETDPSGRRYLNVDVTSEAGIQRAHALDVTSFLEQVVVASSSPSSSSSKPPPQEQVVVIVTPLIHLAATWLVTSTLPAMPVCFLRHPVDRAVSMFYYLQHADWEPTYQPSLANTTIWDYYHKANTTTTTTNNTLLASTVVNLNDGKSGGGGADGDGDAANGDPANGDATNGAGEMAAVVERNWMTRQLVGKMDGGGELTMDDMDHAKRFLEDHAMVGLTDRMGESMRRLGLLWGWIGSGNGSGSGSGSSSTSTSSPVSEQKWHRCVRQLSSTTEDNGPAAPNMKNAFDHPKVLPGSREWQIIAQVNDYDVQLYEHALRVFDAQSHLFAKMEVNA